MGQDETIKKLETLKKRGLGGRAYWIAGKSGTGKTTIACILANMLADSMSIEELDASDLTPAKVKEIDPLLSRCLRLSLAQRGLAEPFAARCYEIACKEGLNGKDQSAYVRMAKDLRNNFRAMLQAVDAGEML